MDNKISTSLALFLLSLSSAAIAQEASSSVPKDTTDTAITLPTLIVSGQETANLRPVATYDTPVSNLEFNPRIDFQSRNMAEAQGDVTIRGGIFENTGFRVGSATLIDPQTGHYSAELPIAPEMLTAPEVLVAGDNALYGFNNTVGTVSYGWSQIQEGGSATIGAGDHDLNFQRIHNALTGTFANTSDWTWGAEIESSRSESDGTIKYGDHDFDRTTGRVQLLGPNSQTDFFAGYQSKFFGWPGMYTSDAFTDFPPETENLKTRLFMVNHKNTYGDNNWVEATAYHRRHKDVYTFNRFTSTSNTIHETKVSAMAIAGGHAITPETLTLNYSAQITSDEVSSVKLSTAPFQSRTYYKLSILPEYRVSVSENQHLTLSLGGSFDDTNRNDSEYSPIVEIEWSEALENGGSNSLFLNYMESTQLIGYNGIAPGGTYFGGDADLKRENSSNLELGAQVSRANWSFEGAVFYRWDDNLVDWVFLEGSENARLATNVDTDTFGIELIATKRWKNVETIMSYTYLNKDEDYGDVVGASSFYALNYAKHRFTLGAIWTPNDLIQVRIDNEWRDQEENALRTSGDKALFTHIGVSVFPPKVNGLELFVALDNAWDDDFQDVPGTPGRGDQVSCGATYRW